MSTFNFSSAAAAAAPDLSGSAPAAADASRAYNPVRSSSLKMEPIAAPAAEARPTRVCVPVNSSSLEMEPIKSAAPAAAAQ